MGAVWQARICVYPIGRVSNHDIAIHLIDTVHHTDHRFFGKVNRGRAPESRR